MLFSDASRIKLPALRHEYAVPLRLLGIGLPLTIALGAALAALLFGELMIAEAVVLATVGAHRCRPRTGGRNRRRLPSRVRQGLTSRAVSTMGSVCRCCSIALSVADAESHVRAASTLSPRGRADRLRNPRRCRCRRCWRAAIVALAGRRDLIARAWMPVLPVAAAALSYGLANCTRGLWIRSPRSSRGALFGALVLTMSAANRRSERGTREANGLTFVVFGAVLLGPALAHVSLADRRYAMLSHTLVRSCRSRSRCSAPARVGRPSGSSAGSAPADLASIVFAVIVVEEAHLPHTRDDPRGDLHHHRPLRSRARHLRRTARRSLTHAGTQSASHVTGYHQWRSAPAAELRPVTRLPASEVPCARRECNGVEPVASDRPPGLHRRRPRFIRLG